MLHDWQISLVAFCCKACCKDSAGLATCAPIGKRLLSRDSVQLYIVGTVSNILTDGFWKAAAPVMLRYVGPEEYTQIVVSAAPENLLAVNEYMKEPVRLLNHCVKNNVTMLP